MLIDLQNDYFPGGNMELVKINKAAINAKLLLQTFRKTNSLVIHIQHFSMHPDSTFFLPETIGVEINEWVAPLKNEKVVIKNYPNGFRDTELLDFLNIAQCKRLVICGAMSHMCIDATARAAFDHGFDIVVAEDACATKDLVFEGKTIKAAEVHGSFMAALSGTYADVLTTNEINRKYV